MVHVAFEDAAAYAAWAGKALPTEAEWEFAARGGLEAEEFAWGDELTPEGRHMANTWQGAFPWQNLAEDGHAGTCPVKSFPPNGYGLYEVCGNVWEWTTDWFAPRHTPAVPASPPAAPPTTRAISRSRGAATPWSPDADPAPGRQGWLLPLRPVLLSPLPPRRASPPDDRYGNQPYRLSLCPALQPV